MASSTNQKSFDHSSIDYVKIEPRRAHMKAFFLHLGLWNEEKVEKSREYGEEQACNLVHTAGHSQVNHLFFEFLVDKIVWHNILRLGNALDQGHDWPWTIDALPDKTDVTTDGASQCYGELRVRKASARLHRIIATGEVLNLKILHGYRKYIPADTRVQCLFSTVSTEFPHHQIKTPIIAEVQRYVLGIMKGAFPSRTRFYTDDEILSRTNYRLIQG
ncbi:hypothetical protein FPCIR_12752 [Fusarium pseudocircinatum]|uniref:Uncharacterized protein n=1 Tax=Fusarium pseudocircinatum TaxID=56676 RepID=A0A8H5KN61_9HYPO|nr:hypothetical protein FPCIR_12752 [Fusarium pseudocircinatum]